MLTIIIIVILLLVLFGGGWWARPSYGPYWGWSPFVLLLILALVLYFLGVIHP